MFQQVETPVDGPLTKHVSATYYTLRWGVATIAVLFPLFLWFGGQLFADLPLQDSMSHYYHAPEGAPTGLMRDWFVGFLFALGGLMYIYKGFTSLENVLLNVASILAICVAVFPMAWPPGSGGVFTLHGACAIGAFACLALVAWLSPGRSLKLMSDESKRDRYTAAYWVVGIFMGVFPIVAWLLTTFLGEPRKLIFGVEALGLLGFVGFWGTKSFEMRDTQGELKALRGLVAPTVE